MRVGSRTQEELMQLGLPKWPMMKVTGQRVTEEQAKEIIRRTDSFLSYPSLGNNPQWEQHVIDTLKLKHGYGKHVINMPMDKEYYLCELWYKKWRYINTTYVSNNWIYSSFGHGPYGWCHPDGEIGYVDNVGKHPSTEAIYNEWTVLAEAFPILDLAITLYNCESCEIGEPGSKPVVSMFIFEGKVTLIDPLTDIDVHDLVVPRRRSEEEVDTDFLSWDKEDGIGIPKSWIKDWADEV